MKRSIFDLAVEGSIDQSGKVSINDDNAYLVVFGDIANPDEFIMAKVNLEIIERISLQRRNARIN